MKRAGFYILFTLCILAVINGIFYIATRQLKKGKEFNCTYTKIHKDYLKDGFDPFLQIRGNNFEDFNLATKNENEVRILILGGSTLETIELSEENKPTIQDQLNLGLKEKYPYKEITILNGATQWHTSKHSLIKYATNARMYNIDIIILMHGINDLVRSFTPKRYSQPKFLHDYSHYYGPVMDLLTEKSLYSNNCPSLTGVSFIDFFSLIASKINIKKNNSLSDTGSYEKFSRPFTDFPSLRSFKLNMKGIIDLAIKDKTEVILMTQPYLYKKAMSKKEKSKLWFSNYFYYNGDNGFMDIESSMKAMEKFNMVTKKIADEKNINFIDLDKLIPRNLENFYDDCHYTFKGSQTIVRSIMNKIESEKLIK